NCQLSATVALSTPHTQREIDLEMDSGQSRRYLFSAGVNGTPERALSLLGEFSRLLTGGGFTHRGTERGSSVLMSISKIIWMSSRFASTGASRPRGENCSSVWHSRQFRSRPFPSIRSRIATCSGQWSHVHSPISERCRGVA